ncbi:unnamed protein product [Caenorhabditis nigoni]
MQGISGVFLELDEKEIEKFGGWGGILIEMLYYHRTELSDRTDCLFPSNFRKGSLFAALVALQHLLLPRRSHQKGRSFLAPMTKKSINRCGPRWLLYHQLYFILLPSAFHY